MEKNAPRIGTGNKRLLVFKQLIRLTILFLFCRTAVLLHGQARDTFVELKTNGTELSLDRELEIEIIIKRNTSYLQTYSGTPRLYLEHEGNAAQLMQSSATPEWDGLHLRYHYRFNTTGRFRCVPMLQWEQHILELQPLDIIVHNHQLSEDTPFFWKLYSSDGQPIPYNTAIEQGTEYLLCLTADFYSAGYTERYLQAIQAVQTGAIRSEENRHEADIQEGQLKLPLPDEILRIECVPSESAALKPLELEECSFNIPVFFDTAKNSDAAPLPHSDAAVLADSASFSDTAGDNNSSALTDTGSERCVLAIFSLIPLRIGIQNLPQAQIFFTAGGKAVSVPASCRIVRQTAMPTVDKSSADGFTAAAFQALPNETPYSGNGMTDYEKTAVAIRIAEYRKQETTLLFSAEIRHKREKLETALGITHPLPLYPRFFGILMAALSGLLLISTALCGLRKKKGLMLFLFVVTVCSGVFTAVSFRHILQPHGVYTGSNGEPEVRHIPESSGSILYRLSIGESFIILRKTSQWHYIKTAGGITGWVSPQSILQYN